VHEETRKYDVAEELEQQGEAEKIQRQEEAEEDNDSEDEKLARIKRRPGKKAEQTEASLSWRQ